MAGTQMVLGKRSSAMVRLQKQQTQLSSSHLPKLGNSDEEGFDEHDEAGEKIESVADQDQKSVEENKEENNGQLGMQAGKGGFNKPFACRHPGCDKQFTRKIRL